MTKPIINHKNICMSCLKETDHLIVYTCFGRGYGSNFDNSGTKLQVCSNCDKPDFYLWYNEKPIMDDYCETYKYEELIWEHANTLPLQAQELFFNTFRQGEYMEQQDWIDMELGILPDEKYEEYCMYSPSQIKAYEERFPTCEHPVNIIYNDNSKVCKCPFGAFGDYGQKLDVNISDECHNCSHYKIRETPIKELDKNTYDKYELYIRGKQYNDLFE